MGKNKGFSILRGNIKNLPFLKYEKDFTFIVDGEKYETTRVIADMLSPIIRNYHFVDESINEFVITTKKCNNYFEDFLNLTNLENIEIDSEHKKAFSEYFLCLGNICEYVHLNTETFKKITNKNVLSRLKLVSKYSSSTSQESYQELVSYFAKKFPYLDKENLKILDVDLLEDIISNKSLQLPDEDYLFEFIWELYKEDHEYSRLFEYVIFTNLSDELMKEFVTNVSFYDLNSSIWKSIWERISESSRSNVRRYIQIDNSVESDTSEKDSFSSSDNDDDEYDGGTSSNSYDDNEIYNKNTSNNKESKVNEEIKTVFVGNHEAGKTSVFKRLIGQDISDVGPTIAPDSASLEIEDYKLNLWDTSGQYRFISLSQVFYRDANVFLFVYDVTNRESFCPDEWIELTKEHEPNGKYIIVANKTKSEQREVTTEEGQKYANDHNYHYIEVDAESNSNIEELLHTIINVYNE